MHDFWHRQENNQPLYEEIVWAKPENKRLKKKIVIAGGNSHAFMQIAASYQSVNSAGIGSCRVVLPDMLEKTVGKSLDGVVYLPCSVSGGFSSNGVATMHEYSQWGDGVFFPGELGQGSETSIFLEKFISETKMPLILSGDSLEPFYSDPEKIFNREDTLLVLDIGQLQKLAAKLGSGTPVTHAMGLVQLIEVLHEITKERESMILTNHEGSTVVAMYGEVTTTHTKPDDNWQLLSASKAAVYFLQHPEKPFQAVTTSLITSQT